MSFYVYHAPDGRVLRAQQYADDSDDQFVEVGEVSPSVRNCFIESGTIVQFPDRPSASHIFDYATKQWVDPRSLDELKAEKWAEIRATRDALIDAPLQTPYGTVDSEAKDRANISDAVLLTQTLQSLGQAANVEFTLADNTVVSLTPSEMITIGLLLGQKVQQTRGIATSLRAAIDAATTAAELESIVWPAT